MILYSIRRVKTIKLVNVCHWLTQHYLGISSASLYLCTYLRVKQTVLLGILQYNRNVNQLVHKLKNKGKLLHSKIQPGYQFKQFFVIKLIDNIITHNSYFIEYW